MKRLEGACLAFFFILVTLATVGGFLLREWRPTVASEHGRGVDHMITYLLITTGVLFVVGHAVLASFLLRYRGQGATYTPLRKRTEWLWTLLPVLGMTLIAEVGVFVIGMPVWAEVYSEAPKDALVVDVAGQQFGWLFRYPGRDGKFGRTDPRFVSDTLNPMGLDEHDPTSEDDLVLRSLHIPVDRTIVVRLRSHDVLHSFSVPEFRIKQDVIPGFTAQAKFKATKTGKYEVACAELCGLGHYRMNAVARVYTALEFERWLKEQEEESE